MFHWSKGDAFVYVRLAKSSLTSNPTCSGYHLPWVKLRRFVCMTINGFERRKRPINQSEFIGKSCAFNQIHSHLLFGVRTQNKQICRCRQSIAELSEGKKKMEELWKTLRNRMQRNENDIACKHINEKQFYVMLSLLPSNSSGCCVQFIISVERKETTHKIWTQSSMSFHLNALRIF